MYSHRLLTNFSKLFLCKSNLINKGHVLENFSANVQKTIPYIKSHFCQNTFVKNRLTDFNPNRRKDIIEEEAQKQLDIILKNPKELARKKIIEIEYETGLANGKNFPTTLRPRDWVEILQLKSSVQRKRFFQFLFINEEKRKAVRDYKEKRSIEYQEKKKNEVIVREDFLSEYGVGKNSFLRRITNPTIGKAWNWNCLKAIMYGNQIVFDWSFDHLMSLQELKSCARQIMNSFASNRQHDSPFHIIMCNVNKSGKLFDYVQRYIPTLLEDDFPITFTSKSYLELFDRDKLVYLTANSPTILHKYNPEHVYIIGSYVDKGPQKPASMAKAKQYKLKMAQLPLDKYMQFGDGSGKNLTLNAVVEILLDAQTKDWNTALKHVPRRKLLESRINATKIKLERELLMHNLNKKSQEGC